MYVYNCYFNTYIKIKHYSYVYSIFGFFVTMKFVQKLHVAMGIYLLF